MWETVKVKMSYFYKLARKAKSYFISILRIKRERSLVLSMIWDKYFEEIKLKAKFDISMKQMIQ